MLKQSTAAPRAHSTHHDEPTSAPNNSHPCLPVKIAPVTRHEGYEAKNPVTFRPQRKSNGCQ